MLAAVIVAGYFLLPWSDWIGSESTVEAASAEVKEVLRGDLVITVTAQGALEAARSVSVISEIEGQAQILKIIEEGSRVRKGDWLCSLDTTNLENQKEKQELAVERAQSAYLQAKASYNITLKQNESETAQAELQLTFAAIELDKFLGVRRAWGQADDVDGAGVSTLDEDGDEKGDRDVQIQEQQNRIKLAQAELENAKDVFEWSEKLRAKDYITKNELERDRIAWERARLDLELSEARMRNLLDFDLRKQEKRLRADVREAELNMDRVRERCEQTRVQAETDLGSKERQLALEQTQLERIEKQIGSGRLIAPQNGLVVYANESSNWRRGREDPIAEGVSVRYHQKIITLPDVSEMIVQVNIHESARSLLWRNQQATITVEALEGKVLGGRVSKVPEVPDSSSGWLTPDRKVYRTLIQVTDAAPEIRPGMSAQVTIYCEKVEDCLYIPVQAVFVVGRDTNFVYVKTASGPEARLVEVGKHNEKNVQVVSGLEQGELVYLSEPRDAVPPAAVANRESRDRVPEGVEISTTGRPAAETGRGAGREGRRRERTTDPARLLELARSRFPDLYEEVKDLPAEEQAARIGARLQAERASRTPDTGAPDTAAPTRRDGEADDRGRTGAPGSRRP